MSYLTTDTLKRLAQKATEPEDVEIPGLGTVRIRALTMGERSEIYQATTDAEGTHDAATFNAMVMARCIIEPKISPQDIGWLQTLPPGTADAILNAIWTKSGINIPGVSVKKSSAGETGAGQK